MKKIIVLVAALALAFGAVSAQAAQTINPGYPGEANLWDVINGWTGLNLDQAALQNAVVLATLAPGGYTVLNVASYANFSQDFGWADGVASAPLYYVPPGPANVNQAVNIPFVTPGPQPFWFYDQFDENGVVLGEKTTVNQNGPAQSNGFIIPLVQFGAGYVGQYIVAFEDGDRAQPFGDSDYNDFVAHLVPIPGAVWLVGSGLLALIGLRRRQK